MKPILKQPEPQAFLDESLSQEDMARFVSGYLRQNPGGRHGEFWTTIRYLFGGYVTA